MVEQFIIKNGWLITLSIITMPIKAYALWQSARFSQKVWFVIIFISNTLGIVDVLYLLLVARKYKTNTEQVDNQ